MGGTGAISTSSVFIVFVTFALFKTATTSSLSQSSERVKRFGDRDPFAEFDKDVRRKEQEFDRHVEQMRRFKPSKLNLFPFNSTVQI